MTPIPLRSSLIANDRYLVYAILGESLVASVANAHCLESGLGSSIHGPIELLDAGGLHVAASLVSREGMGFATSTEQIQDFNNVVTNLHSLGDILPIRYGSILSREDILGMVARERSTHKANLKRLAGCSEIGFRWAVPKQEEQTEATSMGSERSKSRTGLEYLRARRKSQHQLRGMEAQATETRDVLRDLVAGACTDSRTSVGWMQSTDPNTDENKTYSIARVDLLVRRESIGLVMHLGGMVTLGSMVPTIVSGPWPPFSFAEDLNSRDECKGVQTQVDMQRFAK